MMEFTRTSVIKTYVKHKSQQKIYVLITTMTVMQHNTQVLCVKKTTK